jgi:hypothetical protein
METADLVGFVAHEVNITTDKTVRTRTRAWGLPSALARLRPPQAGGRAAGDMM